MDGRRDLRLSICLLIAAAGCQHQVMTLPSSALPSSSAGASEPGQIQTTPAKPKELSPSVLVSYGNFEAGEAFAARTGPERRQQLCESARVDYEKALAIDPKCVSAYQGLARLYTALRDLPLAVETYQKALKLTPTNAALWYELGLCYNYQKNFGPALECLDRAARIEPGNRSYINALGVVFAEAGRYEDSLKCFVRSSGEAMGYYRLAQTLHHLQKPELGRRYLEVALQKDPSLAPPIQQASYQSLVSPELKTSPFSHPAERTANEAPPRFPSPPALPVANPSSASPQAPAADEQPATPPLLLPPLPLSNEDQ
jgi:tetratricopeptide (TPR) repeat protein